MSKSAERITRAAKPLQLRCCSFVLNKEFAERFDTFGWFFLERIRMPQYAKQWLKRNPDSDWRIHDPGIRERFHGVTESSKHCWFCRTGAWKHMAHMTILCNQELQNQLVAHVLFQRNVEKSQFPPQSLENCCINYSSKTGWSLDFLFLYYIYTIYCYNLLYTAGYCYISELDFLPKQRPSEFPGGSQPAEWALRRLKPYRRRWGTWCEPRLTACLAVSGAVSKGDPSYGSLEILGDGNHVNPW